MRKTNIKKFKMDSENICTAFSHEKGTLFNTYLKPGDKILYKFKTKENLFNFNKKYYSKVFMIPKEIVVKQEGDFYLYPFKNIFGEYKNLIIR